MLSGSWWRWASPQSTVILLALQRHYNSNSFWVKRHRATRTVMIFALGASLRPDKTVDTGLLQALPLWPRPEQLRPWSWTPRRPWRWGAQKRPLRWGAHKISLSWGPPPWSSSLRWSSMGSQSSAVGKSYIVPITFAPGSTDPQNSEFCCPSIRLHLCFIYGGAVSKVFLEVP